MAINTLIMGEPGTGKSTSIKSLNPEETFIINVLDKPLPFKSFKKNYFAAKGNYFASDSAQEIITKISFINRKLSDIKYVIIDDFQYIMANEFMRRAREHGFAKFIEIAQNAWEILKNCTESRDGLQFFILSHTENDSNGRAKIKTIGKMVDEKISIEGMFTTVLHSIIIDGKYKFLTQNDGMHIAKSPMGMFDQPIIDNDLSFIIKKIEGYFDCDSGSSSSFKEEEQEKILLEEEQEKRLLKENRKYLLAMQSINSAEDLNQLKQKYKRAFNYLFHDKPALKKLLAEKDRLKEIFLKTETAA